MQQRENVSRGQDGGNTLRSRKRIRGTFLSVVYREAGPSRRPTGLVGFEMESVPMRCCVSYVAEEFELGAVIVVLFSSFVSAVEQHAGERYDCCVDGECPASALAVDLPCIDSYIESELAEVPSLVRLGQFKRVRRFKYRAESDRGGNEGHHHVVERTSF